MRLRTGDWWTAGRKRAIANGARQHPLEEDPTANWHQPYLDELADPNFEAAQPGDAWRIYWAKAAGVPEPIAGYALTCPKPDCPDGVHQWTTASNCSTKGQDGKRCSHEGIGSCWTWTGSAEDGTLTANPSLHCVAPIGCGWHGWLRDGQMVPA